MPAGGGQARALDSVENCGNLGALRIKLLDPLKDEPPVRDIARQQTGETEDDDHQDDE